MHIEVLSSKNCLVLQCNNQLKFVGPNDPSRITSNAFSVDLSAMFISPYPLSLPIIVQTSHQKHQSYVTLQPKLDKILNINLNNCGLLSTNQQQHNFYVSLLFQQQQQSCYFQHQQTAIKLLFALAQLQNTKAQFDVCFCETEYGLNQSTSLLGKWQQFQSTPNLLYRLLACNSLAPATIPLASI